MPDLDIDRKQSWLPAAHLRYPFIFSLQHYNDVIMNMMASPIDCLLNRLFRRRSTKTSKLRVAGYVGVYSPHKGQVTRKMFPFNDVITTYSFLVCIRLSHHLAPNAPPESNNCQQNPMVPSTMYQQSPVCTYNVNMTMAIMNITAMSHKHHGFSSHRQLICSFNCLFRLKPREI